MVDKIWSDWQKISIENKYSYGGGTVTALTDPTLFPEFPTGLPPHLSVSIPSMSNEFNLSCASFASPSFPARFTVTVCGTLQFGM